MNIKPSEESRRKVTHEDILAAFQEILDDAPTLLKRTVTLTAEEWKAMRSQNVPASKRNRY